MKQKYLKEYDKDFNCRFSSKNAVINFELKFDNRHRSIFSELDKLLISKDEIYYVEDEDDDDDTKLTKSDFNNFIDKVSEKFDNSKYNFAFILIKTNENKIYIHYNELDFGLNDTGKLVGLSYGFRLKFANRFNLNSLFTCPEEDDDKLVDEDGYYEVDSFNTYKIFIYFDDNKTINGAIYGMVDWRDFSNDEYVIFVNHNYKNKFEQLNDEIHNKKFL